MTKAMVKFSEVTDEELIDDDVHEVPILKLKEEGTFPKSLKLGGPPKDPSTFDSRAIGWIEDEVDQGVESIIEERN